MKNSKPPKIQLRPILEGTPKTKAYISKYYSSHILVCEITLVSSIDLCYFRKLTK